MGVFTFEHENTSVIPPARLFKALILEGNNLVTKVAPQVIKSIEVIEGDGGVGSIKKVTFYDGNKVKFFKEKIEAIDKENFTNLYTIIEGDVLTDKLEKVSYEKKIIATPDGGSIVKNISKFITKGDAEVSEEEVKAGQQKTAGLFKLIEAYLLANPDAYN
ncbi:Major allergen d 1 [Quillaja saponaria]|uniref:Major allergen d 1 n=1 Tax=Quillaja saponaria TaxID=32244 RepID=A0AAD7PGY2_QUISA|nr:Major allergen d 1 [Quillaja saponaria]